MAVRQRPRSVTRTAAVAAALVLMASGTHVAGDPPPTDTGEVFRSPVHGVAWHAHRDETTRAKWFVADDGARAESIDAIVRAEWDALPPLERVLAAELAARAADPAR